MIRTVELEDSRAFFQLVAFPDTCPYPYLILKGREGRGIFLDGEASVTVEQLREIYTVIGDFLHLHDEVN